MATQGAQFGCFALSKPVDEVFQSDVGSDGKPPRRRKVHAKSRYGCKNCKLRKIKCDEEKPCNNCVKRKDHCSFVSATKINPKTNTSSTEETVSRVARRPSEAQEAPSSITVHQHVSPINLQHLQLLHHFEISTCATFIAEPNMWKEAVIDLALQNTFVMQAVFLVTASHLRYLQPHDSRHGKMVLEQLSQALPSLRTALSDSTDGSPDRGDALMACSILLLQYSWELSMPTDQNSRLESDGWDTLIGLYDGVREIVITFYKLRKEGSRFAAFLIYSPRITIESYFEGKEIPPDIETCFTHLITCTEISDDHGDSLKGWTGDALRDCTAHDAARRLISIWCALKLGPQGLEESGLLLDVARLLFTWPNVHSAGFFDLTSKGGRHQAVLLYYFAAIYRLRSERFWWMRARAAYMFEKISTRLKDKCELCVHNARMLFEEEELL